MKKLLLACILLFFVLPLSAEDPPRFPSATVYMQGVIESRDLAFSIYNEAGEELSGEDAMLSFEFPNLEEWELTQSLYFKFSSHLAEPTVGKLIFSISDLEMNEMNRLRTTLELESENFFSPVWRTETPLIPGFLQVLKTM